MAQDAAFEMDFRPLARVYAHEPAILATVQFHLPSSANSSPPSSGRVDGAVFGSNVRG